MVTLKKRNKAERYVADIVGEVDAGAGRLLDIPLLERDLRNFGREGTELVVVRLSGMILAGGYKDGLRVVRDDIVAALEVGVWRD